MFSDPADNITDAVRENPSPALYLSLVETRTRQIDWYREPIRLVRSGGDPRWGLTLVSETPRSSNRRVCAGVRVQ
jgi:hypothetical protein